MSISTGGALLRASRVFSLPKPLPQPITNLSSIANFQSETATLPYPTQQSITTTQSSQVRGDWGLKRPFPMRSTTRSSTPLIRINAVDTYEQVTDFASAADHTLTLRKWQEIDLPLTTSPVNQRDAIYSGAKVGGNSVFEDKLDTIAPSDGSVLDVHDTRWKFKGPWLASMTEGEFNTYLRKQVSKRKLEFQKFLRKACADALTSEQNRQAPERDGAVLPPVEVNDITDEQLTRYVKTLRGNMREMNMLIRRFLDIPPNNPPIQNSVDALKKLLNGYDDQRIDITSEDHAPVTDSPYGVSGPPATHPSAGLAYGRTASHLMNHPVFGPQSSHPPVQARIVMPRDAAVGNFAPMLGVGGFVAAVPSEQAGGAFNYRDTMNGSQRTSGELIPGLMKIEPDKVGGSKAWVKPESASVDAKGRIVLVVQAAEPESVAVKEGTTDSIPARHEYGRPTRLTFGDGERKPTSSMFANMRPTK
jgi:hypothetical protein